MSRNPINRLLNPQSIAVIGASNNINRAGNLVMRNLLQGNFSGPIMPVTPKHAAVCGVLAYKNIASLPHIPDLAVIAISAKKVTSILSELGELGCQYVIILAAGIDQLPEEDGLSGNQQVLKIAKSYGIRLLGGSSLGMQIPHLGLNASFSHQQALPGKVAFISQSSSIATTMLDWANHKGIGFSHFVSVGETLDLNFNELLDYLGRDNKTQAILLYIDSINDHRHFMSAARTAARSKPIIVIKSGRTYEGQLSVIKHTGQHAGSDVVYDAAFKRSGMLRVNDLHELFAAFETLAYSKPLKGERLAVITNGGAPGIMAVDALISRGGKLAQLEPEILEKLNGFLPSYWSHTNPVDIAGDATPKRFAQAVGTILESREIDTLLIIHSPSATASGEDFATEIVNHIKTNKHAKRINILTNWIGEDSAYAARRIVRKAGLPTYRTPEGAVGAFMHMVEYRRNQRLLQETPKSISRHYATDPNRVREIAQTLIQQGHSIIDLNLAQPLLATYGLKALATKLVDTPEQAKEAAQEIGFPVALKIGAPSLTHKSDIGGVVLNLNSAEQVEVAANGMLERVAAYTDDVSFNGLTIQKMASTAGAQELRFAMHNDPVFGPVLYIGEGGSNWDVAQDAAVALPPLNTALARYMLISALKAGKIKDHRAIQALDINALSIVLTQLSYLIIDCPEIASLDINPMLVSGEDITLLDVNIKLQACDSDGAQRLAIRPYPKELEELFLLRDGREVLLRPIKAEDEQSHIEFNDNLSKEDRYKRFFGEVGQLSHEEMAKMTQIDFDREMAFIATYRDPDNKFHTLGVVRAITDPENHETEFAVVIRSDMQGQGLGKKLMVKMIDYCKHRETVTMLGLTLPQNAGMVSLARKLGFKVKFDIEEGWVEMKLDLQSYNLA
ncbi:bifunctional acetate--CoA ligase family protein/GNAT family N-acetyltransferase [Psychrobium sp. 1_MG-2023]|uniref:bifunctional acetate--CoA ligase family protein/GNAT family N-acetyltransferase n=1 Tax=Psychrobium sp. 1_MG-2023 TaxID=3062624 RepID=UPI000C33CAD3|nr:bifunctional acetate--CoA ligase family protein/GNAT family N-acetyltransferase [Psychrobium sp. 1_MG-2023]MDP2562020.1 bifunctional acetate--CoA ligase family protein/GNAT family N-acetyltransferase [Psychrobium sp. 1_MG-2023]PKF58507.1 protein acetyltransferase [Alteromonadales bacterium alter-6D02]